MSTKQKCRISRHILNAGCCYKEGSFRLSFLPCTLPEFFTVRFTPSVDFTEGDAITIKGRKFTIKTRTMEEPLGKLFSAGAVVQCDIDMEQELAFITPGGEAQGGGVNLGSALPEMNGAASAGSSTNVSREDHIHPSDTSRASTDSPAFTGTPTVPTAPAGTSTTQAASTAFVAAAVTAAGGVLQEIGSRSATGTWTITGVTPYKPLYIAWKNAVAGSYAEYQETSGTIGSPGTRVLIGYHSSEFNPLVALVIPTADTVVLSNVLRVTATSPLVAYQ